MAIHIPQQILEKTNSSLTKHQMVGKNQPILIAFSGGKDSLLTGLILKQLGYTTLALHIDMGFPNSKQRTQHILEMAKKYQLEIEIFNVNNSKMQSMLPAILRDKINAKLTILFKQTQLGQDNYTPCTHCYNVKFLMLQYLADLYKIEHIALGHHGTDAVVSLLKSALMYIDRWDRDHETFTRNNFEQLIFELANIQHLNTKIVARITELVEQNYASTDEPPVKINDCNGKQFKTIRPLFSVFEQDVKKVFINTGIAFLADGCERRVKSMLTPREMIHRKLFATESSLELKQYLHKIISDRLEANGTIKFNARNNRNQLLGSCYKYSVFGDTKL